MSVRELSPSCLAIVQALRAHMPEGRVRLGCSGGPDSMALAGALAYLGRRSPELAAQVEALVVDHQLQSGSHEVADAASERLRGLGIRVRVERVEVDDADGIEAGAREARYTALCRGVDAVLLAHTLDDQAETVLLGLARGAGIRSIAGMAPVTWRDGVAVIRPLLEIRRTQTVQACLDWGIDTWSDPQNADPSFTRARVRHRIMPGLVGELGAGVVENLARTGTIARRESDELDVLVAQLVDTSGDRLDVDELLEHPGLADRAIHTWLRRGGVENPGYANVVAVRSLVDRWRGQKWVELPGAWRVERVRRTLYLWPPGD